MATKTKKELSAIANKAVATRRKNELSAIAEKAVATRKRNEAKLDPKALRRKRKKAARKAWETRRQNAA